MTIFAPGDTQRRLEELAGRVREAWNAYREDLRDLDGRRYEDAETEAWDELQRELQELSAERTHLALALRPPRS